MNYSGGIGCLPVPGLSGHLSPRPAPSIGGWRMRCRSNSVAGNCNEHFLLTAILDSEMPPMISKRAAKITGRGPAIAVVLAAGMLVFFSSSRNRSEGEKSLPGGAKTWLATNAAGADSNAPPARETAAHGGMREDHRDPNIVRQLAHDEIKFECMAAESDRIFPRQVVCSTDIFGGGSAGAGRQITL